MFQHDYPLILVDSIVLIQFFSTVVHFVYMHPVVTMKNCLHGSTDPLQCRVCWCSSHACAYLQFIVLFVLYVILFM